MKCHDGTTATATMTASVVVPYTAAFSTVSAPYFPGWNKAETNFSFANSGHKTATAASGQALCETCHDPHGSDNKRLNAWTSPSGATWGGGFSIVGSRVNTGTAASEQNLCYKCHGNGTANYPRSNGAKDVYTKANLTYAHDPGDYTNRHVDTETAGLLGSANRHAECTDCHDPHVTKKVSSSALATAQSSIGGPALYGAWADQVAFNATALECAEQSHAAQALRCEQPLRGVSVLQVPQLQHLAAGGQTNLALEFNPSNFSFHNVLGQGTGCSRASRSRTPAGRHGPSPGRCLPPATSLRPATAGP